MQARRAGKPVLGRLSNQPGCFKHARRPTRLPSLPSSPYLPACSHTAAAMERQPRRMQRMQAAAAAAAGRPSCGTPSWARTPLFAPTSYQTRTGNERRSSCGRSSRWGVVREGGLHGSQPAGIRATPASQLAAVPRGWAVRGNKCICGRQRCPVPSCRTLQTCAFRSAPPPPHANTCLSPVSPPQAEYALRTAAIKAEPLEIVYSYYNGTGHRRVVTVGSAAGMRPAARSLLFPWPAYPDDCAVPGGWVAHWPCADLPRPARPPLGPGPSSVPPAAGAQGRHHRPIPQGGGGAADAAVSGD